MLSGGAIVVASFAYVALLFAIAAYGDKRADEGRSLIANPYIYALSLAVYCTSWTFYGSVGRAASLGIGFLPIYLGPTLMAALWWFLLVKMIRISKANRITSIADFVASRYGKSQVLGGLVTIIAVVGIIPYIALQLKAISTSFSIILQGSSASLLHVSAARLFVSDNTFYIAMLLAAFTILFGTRHLDATERHEGLVAAIAFESVVKLIAFITVGVFVTWGMFDGMSDLFARAAADPRLHTLLTTTEATGGYTSWASLTLLSMLAILLLPRQFQVAVVENVDERHVNKAIWLFPLYLLVINIFVLPIALAGMMHFSGQGMDADTFMLTLPLSANQTWIVLLAFIGGLSAATGMVIVETIALSTMVCNDLVMPVLLRIKWLRLTERRDLSRLLIGIRRGAIVAVLFLGYVYFFLAGEAYALVSIGLISFAAVAQFAPALIGGMFWRNGTRAGAIAGLSAGFTIWLYTLLLPSFAKSGWLPATFLTQGVLGIDLLKPQQLFGLHGLDEISHCLFWSMLFNIGLYIALSLSRRAHAEEHTQAMLFVDADRHVSGASPRYWHGSASIEDLLGLLGRFLGPEHAREALDDYARRRGAASMKTLPADVETIHHAESLLAGAIGSASARVMIASVVEAAPPDFGEIMHVIDEASQVLAYSRRLEAQSRDLEAVTNDLRAANLRLQELDRMKDDFISTVTHELRTPLTSIRAFSEILRDNPELEAVQRDNFLAIVIRESERLTRLINQVLDLSKLESGSASWQSNIFDPCELIRESADAISQVYRDSNVTLTLALPEQAPEVVADRDRLMQVMMNLLSNAAKFCAPGKGVVRVTLEQIDSALRISVIDNGIGISKSEQTVIFDKFRQVGDTLTSKPKGSGLGLAISRHIVEHLGGTLTVESNPGAGASFSFTVPLRAS